MKLYTYERSRSSIFRTCGYGHGAEWWTEFISTLRIFGYDSVFVDRTRRQRSLTGRGLDQGRQFSEWNCKS